MEARGRPSRFLGVVGFLSLVAVSGGAGCGGECGDGRSGGDEACDDGNTATGDGCDAVCAVEDGWLCDRDGCCRNECVTAGGTECDAGDPEARWVYTCTAGKLCNTLVQTEECALAGTGCEDRGLVPARCINVLCGDGFITASEECDDADFGDGDGCDEQCMIEPGWHCAGEASLCCPDECPAEDERTCAPSGYAILECIRQFNDCLALITDEVCNPGFICADPGDAPACQPCVAPVCGDHLVCPGEPCEDGNLASGDGCSDICMLEGTCGNGLVEPGEMCDDGNVTPGDDCSDTCSLELGTVCGDAVNLNDTALVMIDMNQTTFDGDTNPSGLMNFGDPSCTPDTGGVETVVHRYTTGQTPSTLVVETLDVNGGLDDTVVWAYLDCFDTSAELFCADDGGTGTYSLGRTTLLPAGTTVFIVVAGALGPDVGPYRMRVTEIPYAVEPDSGSCATPTFVSAGNFAGETLLVDGDMLSASCGGSGAPEAVYALDLFGGTLDLTVTVETSDAALDLVVYVLDGTCSALDEIECGNSLMGGGMETFTVANLTAGLYYVVVDGSTTGDAGEYRLQLTW